MSAFEQPVASYGRVATRLMVAVDFSPRIESRED